MKTKTGAGPSDDLGAGPRPLRASPPRRPRGRLAIPPLRGASDRGTPGGDSLPHRGRCATDPQQMSQNVPDLPFSRFFPRNRGRPTPPQAPRSPSFHGFGPGSEGGHRFLDLQEMSQDIPKCFTSPELDLGSEGGPRPTGVRGVSPRPRAPSERVPSPVGSLPGVGAGPAGIGGGGPPATEARGGEGTMDRDGALGRPRSRSPSPLRVPSHTRSETRPASGPSSVTPGHPIQPTNGLGVVGLCP